jgi:hypothetical protein
MMKQIWLFGVFFIEFLFIAALSTQAELADETTWWLIVSPDIDSRSREHLDSLVAALKDRGKARANQIHRLEGDPCSRSGIEFALKQIAREMKREDQLIFYFRGFVTKPRRLNTIVFLASGATSEDSPEAFEAAELNRWFREFFGKRVIVFLDGYTRDQNIEAFYANRELLGGAACVSIQRESAMAKDLFAQNLTAMLQKDAVDLNNNRQITIDELHRYTYEDAALQPMQGILVPTGNVEAVVMKLTPMLHATTTPEGASIFLNGKEVGRTPYQLTEPPVGGAYEVEARKPGYLIPPARSVEIKNALGESVNLSWELETIVVSGRVKAPDEIPTEEVAVWIDNTEYAQNRQPIASDGSYMLPANIAVFVIGRGRSDAQLLTPGQTYTLRAEAREVYVAEATFTLPPYRSVERDLALEKKTWFEVAQMRFDRGEHGPAIVAFQNGIEGNPKFPPMSPEFTKLLFDSLSEVVKNTNLTNIIYIVATAKLADRLGLKQEARLYWSQVRTKAAKGSPEYEMANRRLKELNFTQRLINIGVFIILVIVLASGTYSFLKQRRAKG